MSFVLPKFELGLTVGKFFDSKAHNITKIGFYVIRNQFKTKSSKSKSKLIVVKHDYQNFIWKIKACRM